MLAEPVVHCRHGIPFGGKKAGGGVGLVTPLPAAAMHEQDYRQRPLTFSGRYRSSRLRSCPPWTYSRSRNTITPGSGSAPAPFFCAPSAVPSPTSPTIAPEANYRWTYSCPTLRAGERPREPRLAYLFGEIRCRNSRGGDQLRPGRPAQSQSDFPSGRDCASMVRTLMRTRQIAPFLAASVCMFIVGRELPPRRSSPSLGNPMRTE